MTVYNAQAPSRTYTSEFTVTASGMLVFTMPNGKRSSWLPCNPALVDLRRVTVELDIPNNPTGTTPTLDIKAKTRTKQQNALAVSNTAKPLKNAAGTDFAMTQVTTTATNETKSLAVNDTDTGAANLGNEIGFWAQVGGTTPSYTGSLTVTIGQ